MEFINGKPYLGKVQLNRAYVGDAEKIIPKLAGRVDHFFTDPPYGSGLDFDYAARNRGKYSYDSIKDDNKPFDPRTIALAAMKSSVIFGYDYFPDKLPVVGLKTNIYCSRCRVNFDKILDENGLDVMTKEKIVCPKCKHSSKLEFTIEGVAQTGSLLIWDKRVDNLQNDNSDFEIAWVSKPGARRMFRHEWNGFCRATERDTFGLHPTQKPIALGLHIVKNYSDVGDFIVDPYCGVGFIAIACAMLGNRYWLAFDINANYVALTNERCEAARLSLSLEDYRAGQISLFK